jgi:hypothetical protein
MYQRQSRPREIQELTNASPNQENAPLADELVAIIEEFGRKAAADFAITSDEMTSIEGSLAGSSGQTFTVVVESDSAIQVADVEFSLEIEDEMIAYAVPKTCYMDGRLGIAVNLGPGIKTITSTEIDDERISVESENSEHKDKKHPC